MSRRFFVSTTIAGKQAVLSGQEAHHLLHVLRGEVGDQVVLFDGSQYEYVAEVASRQRNKVVLTIEQRRSVKRELGAFIHLGVALPKGERQRWLVEKCVELGCGRLTPLVTSRGVAQPTSAALERLQRTVIEASKQSGRNRLMELADPTPWCDFVAAGLPGTSQDEPNRATIRWLADPRARQSVATVAHQAETARSIRLAIGPEGGFTEEELDAATLHQWQAVHLGPRILRIETAAVALVAYWSLTDGQLKRKG